MQPNTKTHTALSASGGIQGVTGKPKVGNAEKIAQPCGVFKKMTARSGWDDLIYPIKNGHIMKRAVGKNLPQSLPDSGSDWQSVTEADCSRFRCIQTPFGAWLHG